jgi:hypothetical protein
MSRRIRKLIRPKMDRVGEISVISISQEVQEAVVCQWGIVHYANTLSKTVGSVDSAIIGNGSRGINFILVIKK